MGSVMESISSWQNFSIIEEFNFNDVGIVLNDAVGILEYYGLNGIRIMKPVPR